MFKNKKTKVSLKIYERDEKYGTYKLEIYDKLDNLIIIHDYNTYFDVCRKIEETNRVYSVSKVEYIDLNPYNYTQESKDIKDIFKED